MATISIRAFGGVSPKTPPRLLNDRQAQTALDSDVFTGTLKPTKGLGTSVATVASSTISLYNFGQDNEDPTQGWLSWTTDVDVVRSQINGDTEEWTFYSGDGYPKAIRAGFLASPIHLGLKAPASPLIATLGAEPEGAESLSQETRVYTYTYVNKVGAREIESAPAPPATSVDVYPGQSVTLTGFITPATNFTATHVRVYR